MDHLKNHDGFVKIIVLVSIFALAFVLLKDLVMPNFLYYQYSSAVKGSTKGFVPQECREIQNMASKTQSLIDDKIAKDLTRSLLDLANEYKIPLQEKDITVTLNRHNVPSIMAQLSWTEKVNILGAFNKNFDFTMEFTEIMPCL